MGRGFRESAVVLVNGLMANVGLLLRFFVAAGRATTMGAKWFRTSCGSYADLLLALANDPNWKTGVKKDQAFGQFSLAKEA